MFSARRLTSLRRVPKAHMVFVTAIAFSADERFLLSVSADARCCARIPTLTASSLHTCHAANLADWLVIVPVYLCLASNAGA